jgi:parallel beta-helix repeat protein
MGRREKAGAEELKVTFEAITGRQGGKGIFGIEDEADGLALEDDSGGNFISNNKATNNLEDGIDLNSTTGNTVFSNTGDHNGSDPDFDNGLEVDDGSGNTLTNNVFNYDTRHGICAIPGNTDGGGNKGKGNGVPPDVSFNDSSCGGAI